jgi:hypothetical protein
MRINIIALNDVFDTGLSTLIDAFTTANELAEITALTSLRFDVSIVGVRKSVKTAQGLSVPVGPVTRAVPDCVDHAGDRVQDARGASGGTRTSGGAGRVARPAAMGT